MDPERVSRPLGTVSRISPRRQALRLLGAAGLAAAGASATLTADAKKRCRKRLQACDSNKQCCGGGGDSACRPLGTNKSHCVPLPTQFCCGQEGASCKFDNQSCDCCGDLLCIGPSGKKGKCQPEPT